MPAGSNAPGPVASGATAPPTAAPLPPPGRPALWRRALGAPVRLLSWMFPADGAASRRSDGLLSAPGPELPGWTLALVLAALVAILYEVMAAQNAIPPGGDPSTWLVFSYPYVGVAYPPQAGAWFYPPLAFPFLGSAVVLTGDPLMGVRVFMAGAIVAFGASAYTLSRTLLTSRVLALMAEGLILLDPQFGQMYYFGGIPNLVGLTFMFLALAAFTRYLRSRQTSHGVAFWALVAATVLTHTLTGVILGGIVGIAGLILLLRRRLPRSLFVRPANLVAIVAAAGAIAAYYEGATLAHIPKPSYINTGPLSQLKQQLIPTVVRPFYLATAYGWVTGQPPTFGVSQTVDFLIAGGGAILLVVLLLQWKRPAWLTERWAILAAWFLTVFAITLAGYYLNLSIDYRRFPYFLYGPVSLLLVVTADRLLVHWGLWGRTGDLPPAPPTSRRQRWRRTLTGPPARVVLAGTVAVVLLSVLAGYSSVPAAQKYEAFFAPHTHDPGLVSVLQATQASGVPGNIYSITATVDRWPSALTSRATYEPRPPTGNVYTPGQLDDAETATLALSYRYTVTNTLVSASVPGITAGNFNGTPVYGIYDFGSNRPVLLVPPGSLVVGFTSGPNASLSPRGLAAPAISVNSSGGGTLSLTFSAPGVVVNETVTTVPGQPTALIHWTATATRATPLAWVGFRLASASVAFPNITASGPTSFLCTTATPDANYTTSGSLTASNASSLVVPGNSTNRTGPVVILRASAPSGGSSVITATLNLTTPGVSNVISSLGPLVSTPTAFEAWQIRFVLVDNGQNTTATEEMVYFMTEYGAVPYASSGVWTVLMLPEL